MEGSDKKKKKEKDKNAIGRVNMLRFAKFLIFHIIKKVCDKFITLGKIWSFW